MFTLERLPRAARRIRPRARHRFVAAGSALLVAAGLAAAPAPAGGPVGGYLPHVDVVAQSPAVPAPSAVVTGTVTDGCWRTDGIDALAANLGPLYPSGGFSGQDNRNELPGTQGNQAFKLIRLERILDF